VQGSGAHLAAVSHARHPARNGQEAAVLGKPAVAYGDLDGLFDLLLYPAISPFEPPGITNPIHQLADVDGPFDADDLIGQR